MAKPRYYTAEDEITFNLLDVHTVNRLVRNGDIKLPRKKLDVAKDERWNTKQMSSRLLQGILSGDSIPNIASRLLDVVNNNEASAIRNARTMVTGAENSGRLDSYNDLAEKGVIQRKVWIATYDDRTRESHAEINGEEVEIDKVFSNGLMYPGDFEGDDVDPSEVWNCRCSMRDHIVGFRRADGSISYIAGEEPKEPVINIEPVNTIEQTQVQELPAERIESDKLHESMSQKDYDAFMDLVNEADNGELYRTYADNISTVTHVKAGGQFEERLNTINYSYENHEGLSRYSTVAHEYNHFFDSQIGRAEGLHFTEIDLINERCQIGSGLTQPVRGWASGSDEFLTALRQDMEALHDQGLNLVMNELHSGILNNTSAGVQDALDGFFNTQAQYGGWGHGSRYYNTMYNHFIKEFGHASDLKDAYNELGFNVTSQAAAAKYFRQYRAANEAWANIGSAVTCGGEELAVIEKYMPATLNAYKEIVGGLANG